MKLSFFPMEFVMVFFFLILQVFLVFKVFEIVRGIIECAKLNIAFLLLMKSCVHVLVSIYMYAFLLLMNSCFSMYTFIHFL